MSETDGLRTRVAVRAAVLSRGRVLMIRYTDPVLHYNLPGGTARPDESLAQTASRKAAASLGADIVPGRLLFVHETLPAGRGSDPTVHHKLEFVLLAEPAPGADALRAYAAMGGIPQWVPVEAVADLPLRPPFQRRLAAALLGPALAGDSLLLVDAS